MFGIIFNAKFERMFMFVVLFIQQCSVLTRANWIDPHTMNVEAQYSIPTSNIVNISQQNEREDTLNVLLSHYKRILKLLLNTLDINESLQIYNGHADITLTNDDYVIIKHFVQGTEAIKDTAILRRLDQILSNSLVKPLDNQFTNVLSQWNDYIYIAFYNRSSAVMIVCLFLFFISYKLLKANLTLWYVMKYLIFIGWIMDFVFTWINLLQEGEINKMAELMKHKNIPQECNPKDLSFLDYFFYKFSSENICQEYYHTIYKDIFWGIAPLTVLSHQFGTLILTPASYMGEAFGSFTSKILSVLPWGVNIILLPIVLIFFIVILCMSLSFLTGTPFAINIFHVLKCSFGNEQRQQHRENVNMLITVEQRSMIEEVQLNDLCKKLEVKSCTCKKEKTELTNEGESNIISANVNNQDDEYTSNNRQRNDKENVK